MKGGILTVTNEKTRHQYGGSSPPLSLLRSTVLVRIYLSKRITGRIAAGIAWPTVNSQSHPCGSLGFGGQNTFDRGANSLVHAKREHDF